MTDYQQGDIKIASPGLSHGQEWVKTGRVRKGRESLSRMFSDMEPDIASKKGFGILSGSFSQEDQGEQRIIVELTLDRERKGKNS
jgi:hypothetical protein